MALELHIEGPGLDALCVLQPGEPDLVLGRDADCGVCLPDPQRNVSRRHLAVSNIADEMHFVVLSVVNGVEIPSGVVPPGAKGVLASGDTLKLAEYNLTVELRGAAPVPEPDPWAVFDADGPEATAALGARRESLGAGQAQATATSTLPEEDPFGDWGFQTTFGPGTTGGGPLDASRLGAAGDLSPFFQGLGLDPEKVGQLSQGELEAIGSVVRAAVVGLFELRAASIGVAPMPPVEDITVAAAKTNSPLQTDASAESKLRYLFGGRATSFGFVNPERAVRELVSGLMVHDLAVGAATRAVVEGTVREFSPEVLKAKLLSRGVRLFASSRAWEAYFRYYSAQSQAMPQWIQRLLDKHFTETYLRESARLKSETSGGKR